MSDRPGFLTVSYGGSGLQTMGYEKRMIRENDVKFDNEDGSFELTDVRLVWYRKPGAAKGGKLKKFGALAGAIAGAAVLDSVGSRIGGIGGSAIRGVGRGIAGAAVYSAFTSWTAENFYNVDPNGNTESLAVPIVAISNAAQSGSNLVVELKSGGTMSFSFKQSKVIPSVIANITQAQTVGKCPYCGANAGRAARCPKCGASIDAGGGEAHVHEQEDEGPESATLRYSGGAGRGDPDSVTISFGRTGRGGQPDSMTIQVDQPAGAKGSGKFCMNCGSPLPAGAKFCNNCGQRV
ncbi:MAG: zinc ribbon domain-containing protein [Candidatus Thorarchaeota archaeon]|nr:zinc ribbon domain-containing protein [Candidatus Thorarchaeota archaeon]